MPIYCVLLRAAIHFLLCDPSSGLGVGSCPLHHHLLTQPLLQLAQKLAADCCVLPVKHMFRFCEIIMARGLNWDKCRKQMQRRKNAAKNHRYPKYKPRTIPPFLADLRPQVVILIRKYHQENRYLENLYDWMGGGKHLSLKQLVAALNTLVGMGLFPEEKLPQEFFTL